MCRRMLKSSRYSWLIYIVLLWGIRPFFAYESFYEKEGTFTSITSFTLATSSSVSGDFSTFRFSGFAIFLLLSNSGIVTKF